MPTVQPRANLTSGPKHVTAIFGNDDSEMDGLRNAPEQDPWKRGRLPTSPSGLSEGGSRALMKAVKGLLYQDHANGKPPVPKPVSGMSVDKF